MINIDWTRLVSWNVPSVLRNTWMVNWLMALISPVITLHSYLLSYQRQSKTEILTNGQVTKLRAYLNLRFDILLKRINIVSLPAEELLYVYLTIENKPLYMPVFLTSGDGYDFVVEVPVEFQYLEADIKAVINKFKLPTKKYYIIYI